jgi:hypothetical protein
MSEETQQQFDDLQEKYDDLVEAVSFADINRRVSNITSRVTELPAKIEELRGRGYVYASYLENKASVFGQQWEEIRERVTSSIDEATETLDGDVRRPKTLLTTLERQLDNEAMFGKLSEQASGAIESLEQGVDAAKERIEAIFETLERDLDSTYRQLSDMAWYMDQKDEASFDFGPAETVFLVADAELVLSGKKRQDPDGVLFLTNQRLVFEQKEKTGKRMGMFGGKMEQEVEWEVPLSAVDKIEIENQGMFGGKDMMHFEVNEGDLRRVTVEVKGKADNKFWQKQINRMIRGEAEDERAIEPDAEMLESLQNAPTACHVCGATLPKLVAGQTEISCEYCGTVVRI